MNWRRQGRGLLWGVGASDCGKISFCAARRSKVCIGPPDLLSRAFSFSRSNRVAPSASIGPKSTGLDTPPDFCAALCDKRSACQKTVLNVILLAQPIT